MKPLFIVCTFFLFICSRSFGQENYLGGIVYGPKAAFNISAPKGWVLDNESGASHGLPCDMMKTHGTPKEKVASGKTKDGHNYFINEYRATKSYSQWERVA